MHTLTPDGEAGNASYGLFDPAVGLRYRNTLYDILSFFPAGR
jgi:hypothetical protein